jgi:hypothetical protein
MFTGPIVLQWNAPYYYVPGTYAQFFTKDEIPDLDIPFMFRYLFGKGIHMAHTTELQALQDCLNDI